MVTVQCISNEEKHHHLSRLHLTSCSSLPGGTFTFNGEDFPSINDDAIKKNKEQCGHPEKERCARVERDPAVPAPVLITCRACSVSLNSSDFSKTQMKKDDPRCNNCIKNAGQSSFPCKSPTVGSEVRFTAQRAFALSFQFPSFNDHNSWLPSFLFAHRFGATIILVSQQLLLESTLSFSFMGGVNAACVISEAVALFTLNWATSQL